MWLLQNCGSVLCQHFCGKVFKYFKMHVLFFLGAMTSRNVKCDVLKEPFGTDGLLWFNRNVKCTKHNWKLNVSTMKYVNPPDSFLQDELGKSAKIIFFLLWRLISLLLHQRVLNVEILAAPE